MGNISFEKFKVYDHCYYDRFIIPSILVGKIKYDHSYEIYINIIFWKWSFGLLYSHE